MELINQIEFDYAYCETIIKKSSKSFYYSFSSLPQEKARAIYAVYAFCRLADNSVDENKMEEEQEAALGKIREELDLFREGKEVSTPLWRALRDVFSRFDMAIEPFYEQLRGQQLDIEFTIPANLTALERYSYYVAGSVGLMLLPILATVHHSRLKEAAVSLGIAMQLTNILRDIGEDYFDKNRIYIPEELLSKNHFLMLDFENASVDQRFISIWETLAQQAEQRYDIFGESIHLFDADCQYQVLLAANVYRGILDVIRKNHYQCWKQRHAVSKLQLNQIVLKTKQQLRQSQTL